MKVWSLVLTLFYRGTVSTHYNSRPTATYVALNIGHEIEGTNQHLIFFVCFISDATATDKSLPLGPFRLTAGTE